MEVFIYHSEYQWTWERDKNVTISRIVENYAKSTKKSKWTHKYMDR